MLSRYCFLFLWVFGLLTITPVIFAQEKPDVIDDPEGRFSLTLPARGVKPESGWHAVEITDGLGRKQLEIIYKVREEGLLKVRRIEIEKGAKLLDVIRRDESQTLTFLPGYTRGKVEDFSVEGGRTPASLAAFDFTQGGRPKMGRNYYIQVGDATVYVLRFTGNRGTMGALRSQTDLIARSFRVKP